MAWHGMAWHGATLAILYIIDMTPSQNWILKSAHGSSKAVHEQAKVEHEQVLEFSDLGYCEPGITDSIKSS